MVERLIKYLGVLILTAVVIVTLIVAFPLPFQRYVVLTDSMKPELPPGSLVFVYYDSPENVDEGDIIAFYATSGSKTPTTHRVVENDSSSHQFITKGDNNPDTDIDPIPWVRFVGKVVFHLPVIGYVMAMMTEMKGKIIMIAIAATAVIMITVGNIIINRKTEMEE